MDIRSVFSINGVAVDLANETLLDGSGNPVALRPQCFAILRHLVENADRLVTKNELMAAVWPQTAVTDDSLVQCIYQVRRALDDEGHTVLKTVPKRGYRLMLSGVAEQASVPPSDWKRHHAWIGLAAVGLVLALATVGWWPERKAGIVVPNGLPLVAVLPFDVAVEDIAAGDFADGITDELATNLSKLTGIVVAARDWVTTSGDKAVAANDLAAELGVRYVLEGRVQREGEQVRILAQLVDASAGHNLWAERYDGAPGDTLVLQDKIAGAISSAVAVELASVEAGADRAVEPGRSQASDAFLLGWDQLRRDTEQSTLEAIGSFERALNFDPNYAEAYAAIAAARLRIVLSNYPSTSGSGLDGAYADLQTSLAHALKRPTPLADAVAAVWAVHNGRIEEGLALIEKASALAPNDPQVLISRANVLNATGRADEAEKAIRLAMHLDPGFSPVTLRALSAALLHQKKYQEAIDTVERIAAQGAATGDDYVTLVSSFGELGRTDGVREAIDSYNRLVVPAAGDPMSVQSTQWSWNGGLFSYHRPYVAGLVEGLRKAGVSEGAGADIGLDDYAALIRRQADGGVKVERVEEISARVAGGLYDRGVAFVDVRSRASYASGHIPGAINLSLVSDLSKDQLKKVAGADDEIVFYCGSNYCDSSALAAARAIFWGYRRVYQLTGGIPAWKDQDCPIELALAE